MATPSRWDVVRANKRRDLGEKAPVCGECGKLSARDPCAACTPPEEPPAQGTLGS